MGVVLIDLARWKPPSQGNGALEAVDRFLDCEASCPPEPEGSLAERLVTFLWIEGYKITPLTAQDGS